MSNGRGNREIIGETKRAYHPDFINLFKVVLTELRAIRNQAREPDFIVDRPAIRIKKGVSICKNILHELKTVRTPEDLLKNFPDMLGVRIVCLDVDNVWRVRDALRASETIEIVSEEDFITHPEPDGYRSLHLYVRAKSGTISPLVVAEIQIRTPAQHCWATLTHRDAYKGRYILPKSLESRFRNLSERFFTLEEELRALRQEVAISPLTDEAKRCADARILGRDNEPRIAEQEWWASGETFY